MILHTAHSIETTLSILTAKMITLQSTFSLVQHYTINHLGKSSLGLAVYFFIFGNLINASVIRVGRYLMQNVSLWFYGPSFSSKTSGSPFYIRWLHRAMVFHLLWHRQHHWYSLSYWVTRSNFHPPWCLWSAIPLDALDLWKQIHEYVFGLMGLLISDFSMLNVLQMAPKLTVCLQAACHSRYQCFGETASGYLWLSTSKLLPDSDPAMPNDLEMHVQGVLQRSLKNSESTTTVTPTRIQCKNQDPPLSSMPLTPSNNFIFLVEIQQHHQTKEAKKGVHITSGTKALRPNIASSDTSEDPITECCLLKQKNLRSHEGCWWQQEEHGSKHRSQSVCSMDKDSWTVFTISSPLKYPERMQEWK